MLAARSFLAAASESGLRRYGPIGRRRFLVSAAEKPSCWVIIGPPGSGKGTYAKLLAKRFNLDHFSTGDLARIKFRDPALRGLMDSGQLLPDEEIIPLLEDRLAAVPASASGVLLDGFPRTVQQAAYLERLRPVRLALEVQLKDKHIMKKTAGRRTCSRCGTGYNVENVHDIEDHVFMPPMLPASTSLTSCNCGGALLSRADDIPDVVAARLAVHHRSFAPIIQLYKDRKLLLEYRVRYGVGDMEDLYKLIEARLSGLPGRVGMPPISSIISGRPVSPGPLRSNAV